MRSVTVVGANGSGKSRLGYWIEKNNRSAPVHRIAAQRALAVPDLITPQPFEQALSELHYGFYEPSGNRDVLHLMSNKFGHRWRHDPVGHLLNDYAHLLATLFADEAKRNRDYTRAARVQASLEPVPDCKLDTLQQIWAAVFPHRTLLVGDDKIEAQVPNGPPPYAGKLMSDGERVALYLIGQALCAPHQSVLIIDEPEIHLHRAIQAPLWDQVEAARPDCVFVYITHDLDFAATRATARKVWLKAYDGTHWEWEELQAHPSLPDQLVFEVLGNRRPVLFVEGDDTSHDVALYRALFPDRLVLPRQGCDKVVEATKAMQALDHLHHLEVRGLIDRDHRSDEEIASLRHGGLAVADVAEVENLLCLSEVIDVVVNQLKIPDATGARQKAQQWVLDELRKGIDLQVTARALAEIQFKLGGFGPKAGGADAVAIERVMRDYVGTIDVPSTFQRSRSLFEGILRGGDYRSALRYYNCKGTPSFVASALGLKVDVYRQMILEILKSEPGGSVGEAMRKAISLPPTGCAAGMRGCGQ